MSFTDAVTYRNRLHQCMRKQIISVVTTWLVPQIILKLLAKILDLEKENCIPADK